MHTQTVITARPCPYRVERQTDTRHWKTYLHDYCWHGYWVTDSKNCNEQRLGLLSLKWLWSEADTWAWTCVSHGLCSQAQRVSEKNVSLRHKHSAQSWKFSSHLVQHLFQKIFLFTSFNFLLARQHTKHLKNQLSHVPVTVKINSIKVILWCMTDWQMHQTVFCQWWT